MPIQDLPFKHHQAPESLTGSFPGWGGLALHHSAPFFVLSPLPVVEPEGIICGCIPQWLTLIKEMYVKHTL